VIFHIVSLLIVVYLRTFNTHSLNYNYNYNYNYNVFDCTFEDSISFYKSILKGDIISKLLSSTTKIEIIDCYYDTYSNRNKIYNSSKLTAVGSNGGVIGVINDSITAPYRLLIDSAIQRYYWHLFNYNENKFYLCIDYNKKALTIATSIDNQLILKTVSIPTDNFYPPYTFVSNDGTENTTLASGYIYNHNIILKIKLIGVNSSILHLQCKLTSISNFIKVNPPTVEITFLP